MKCGNCGHEESEHANAHQGGPCYVYTKHMGNRWWWLSFADKDKAPGTQFLGAVIIEGSCFLNATHRAHMLNINPGGEVMCMPIPDDKLHNFPENMRNRLLSEPEARSFE